MFVSQVIFASVLAIASAAPNAAVQTLESRRDRCPPVWLDVKAELNVLFTEGAGSQCNGLARDAIRAVFHDCGTWDIPQGLHGGCDGSLFTGVSPDVELDRDDNKGLQDIAVIIKNLAAKYQTSVADMIVFAGNAATSICPQGPFIHTFIGRTDNTTSAPPGRLPDVHDTAANLFALFAAKGFSALDLAALLGAHSTSTQDFVDPSQANKSQDTTPGTWDVKYYKQTLDFAHGGKAPDGVFVFPSDAKLAVDPVVGPKFKSFVNQPGQWQTKYRDAASRMALLGNDPSKMVDCTHAAQA